MNITSVEHLKDLIANMDLEVYIIRQDIETIDDALRADDIRGYKPQALAQAITELQKDPYIVKLKQTIK